MSTLEQLLEWRDKGPIPDDIHPLLRAMLLEAAGDWDAAHTIAQNDSGPTGAWVHAYLHRVEGDLGNAGYWYSRAGKALPSISLREEWEQIALSIHSKASFKYPNNEKPKPK
ncbi:MAG: hypothetical protein CSA96_05955 [Bacteroidetes bacterium]|nr:MAG: hypothetical protein CSA96_05955 [Bacteroidota bacterium]